MAEEDFLQNLRNHIDQSAIITPDSQLRNH